MSNGSSIFKQEAKDINKHFAELNYEEDAQGSPAIVGDLVLKDEAETIIDKYSIKIVSSERYPYRFPRVYETGGRIPINVDWHVFPDGHCCIKAIPEEMLLCRKSITLYSFIQEQVVPYFFNQKYREMNGFFLRERSHGVQGTIEYFKDHFKTQKLNLVLKFLKEMYNTKELKSNSKCLCESGRKFKKCHRRSLRAIKMFSKSTVENFIEAIQAFSELN